MLVHNQTSFYTAPPQDSELSVVPDEAPHPHTGWVCEAWRYWGADKAAAPVTLPGF